MRYRDSKGRFISKKEHERRLKISESLKKYHATKKKSVTNAKARKPTTTKPKTNKTKPKSKTKKSTSKSTFTEKRKRTKVKTFPTMPKAKVEIKKKGQKTRNIKKKITKSHKDNFFYTNKKEYLLNRKIHIKNESDLIRVEKSIIPMKESIYKFFKESKGKKRSKIMNLGYMIELVFISKDKKQKTVINTKSFIKGISVSKQSDINRGIDLLIENMIGRFTEYLARQGFFKLSFSGIEAEFEV